ncbi:oligosaccharide flippase family protein [Pseudoalteromonas sp. JBTF-M23]|uniref:Oligosaccharide flippase family protein n=1 Tax=Pseudoalteromonas caenipelagi TaxID=2726988 RepID=A0A849VGB3_9GAMM|nr:oligosaccharide flippase family protein [Pseudoalteromonas caenipelagi]NOU51768.1 oligosaccharide flippase family protein [Pseudoalteromonas caenipelagi]
MKMIKNLLSFSVVGLLPYFINFITLPLYSEYISAEQFGIIGLMMSGVIIATSWTGFQFSSAISRYFFDYEADELKSFTSTVIFLTLGCSSFFCLIYAFLISQGYFSNIFNGISTQVLYIGVFLIFLSILNTVFERLLINEQKGSLILMRSIVAQGLSVFVGVILILYFGMSYMGFLISSVVYYSAMVLFSLRHCRHYLADSFNFNYADMAVKYSFPLIFHSVGGVLFMYSTTFFIESFLTLSMVGLFFIVDKFTQIIKAIVNSINNILMPIYNKSSVTKNKGGAEFFEKTLPVWYFFVNLLIVNFAVVAQSFMVEFMGSEYKDLLVVILIMSMAYLFRGLYCFCMAPIFFYKKTMIVPKVTLVTGILSLLVNYVFVSKFGFVGAAIAVFSVFLINFLLSLFESKKVEVINFRFGSLLLMTCVILLFNLPALFVLDAGFIIVFMTSIAQCLAAVSIVYKFNLFHVRESFDSLRLYK